MEQFSRKTHDHFSKIQPLNNGFCHVLNVPDLQPPATSYHQAETDPCSLQLLFQCEKAPHRGGSFTTAQRKEKFLVGNLVNES